MTAEVLNTDNELAVLANYIRAAARPPEDELAAFCSLFRVKHFSNGQHIFKANRLINYIYFVTKGCLRLYNEAPNGSLHTIGFFEEQDFIMDMYSFVEQQPTTLNLQATEDCTMLAINRSHWNAACQQFLWYKPLHERRLAQQIEGIYQYLSQLKKAGVKRSYARLIKSRPRLLQRLPDELLAAYLNIAVSELSELKATGT